MLEQNDPDDEYLNELDRRLINNDIEENASQSNSTHISNTEDLLPFDIRDHFSLRSTLHRLRNKIVLDGVRHQLIFSANEENDDDPRKKKTISISLRRAARYGGGTAFVKFALIYVMVFIAGVAGAFCIVVFLQYGLGVFLVGMRSGNPVDEQFATMCTLLSIPACLDFFAYMFTIGTGALSDVWNDYEYLNTFTILSPFVRDWARVILSFFIPVLVLACCLIMQYDYAVAIFLLTAIVCNLFMFLFYIVYTSWLEVYSCVRIIRSCHNDVPDAFSALLKLFVVRFELVLALTATHSESPEKLKKSVVESPWYAFWFTPLESPRRLWNLTSVIKPKPIYTNINGSMFFLCCMLNRRFRGSIPRSVFDHSMGCVTVTAFLTWLTFVGYLSFLSSVPAALGVFAALIAAGLCCWWVRHVYRKYLHATSFHNPANVAHETSLNPYDESFDDSFVEPEPELNSWSDSQSESDSDIDDRSIPSRINMDAYERSRKRRSAKYIYAYPKPLGALLIVLLRVTFYICIPLYGFIHIEANGFGYFFLLAAANRIRSYVFDVEKLIEVYGPKALSSLELPLFDSNFLGRFDEDSRSSLHTHSHAQSPTRRANTLVSRGARRVYLLLTRMKKSQTHTIYLALYGFGVLGILLLVAVSVNSDTSLTNYQGAKLAGNSTHLTHIMPSHAQESQGFGYPLCSLFSHMHQEHVSDRLPRSPSVWHALDLVFLSDLAYTEQDVTQPLLDQWFLPGTVKYIKPENYPRYAQAKKSSVVFKLFRLYPDNSTEPNDGDMYVISVRGTKKPFDLLADMQIWFPALTLQLVGFALPFASMWNSVLPYLIWFTNALESAPMSELSYVDDLIDFTRALREKNPSSKVVITGHSLGGGVAMIVGAHEKILGVGVSGPNAMLSRFKFGISKADLDQYTFNIIPKNDPVPMIDQPSLLTEHIACRSSRQYGDGFGACHMVSRTLCEVQYVCGSGVRPPVSNCNDLFGFYPDPRPIRPSDWLYGGDQEEQK